MAECKKKDTCKNYEKKCSECWAYSSIYDTHPLYTSKDLVEVVRCKDCERAKMYVFGCGNTEHLACVDTDDNGKIVFAQAVEPNHFCSYGTPKKRGGEK